MCPFFFLTQKRLKWVTWTVHFQDFRNFLCSLKAKKTFWWPQNPYQKLTWAWGGFCFLAVFAKNILIVFSVFIYLNTCFIELVLQSSACSFDKNSLQNFGLNFFLWKFFATPISVLISVNWLDKFKLEERSEKLFPGE